MFRVFTTGPGFNPRSNLTKDSKMVLDATLLKIQHYKVWIKGKVGQSWVVAIVKGALGLLSTTVANFTYYISFIDSHVHIYHLSTHMYRYVCYRHICTPIIYRHTRVLIRFINSFS